MRAKKWIIFILVATVTFLIGSYIEKIYGFDPPYIYFYTGFVMKFVAILVGIIATLLLVINVIKQK